MEKVIGKAEKSTMLPNICFVYNKTFITFIKWQSFISWFLLDSQQSCLNLKAQLFHYMHVVVGRNTFLLNPHLCFIKVFICDLFVSRDDPLMS